jgi:hypothetical protein
MMKYYVIDSVGDAIDRAHPQAPRFADSERRETGSRDSQG